MNADTAALLGELEALLVAGTPRQARALLLARKPPLDAELVLVAAEVYAASGRPRRGAALLWLAARRLGTIGTARAAARALLTLGRHRRARLVLEPHAADGAVAVLMAVARSEPLPLDVVSPVDVDDVLDRALSQPTSTASLHEAMAMAPTSARARLAVVARLRAEGDAEGSRALLRAGLKGREDARLELPLAMAAVDDGAWDEAALVLARARARHPDLARRADLRLVLAWATLQAGRRDDAISMLRGAAGANEIDTALLQLLDPRQAPTTPALRAVENGPASGFVADAKLPAGQSQRPPPLKSTLSTPVTMLDAASESTNPIFRRFAIACFALVVLVAVGKTVIDRWPRADAAVDVKTAPVVTAASSPAAGDFSRRADECGVAFPAVFEPGLLYAEVAARLIASGYNGLPVSAGSVVVALSDAVSAPGDSGMVHVLESSARVAPGVVVVDERATGVAIAHTTDSPRPLVSEIVRVRRMGLGPTSPRACAVADPGFTCVSARSTCQQLEIVVGAICPDNAKTTNDLRSCAFDVVVVRVPPIAAADAGSVTAAAVDAGPPVDAGVVDAGVVGGAPVEAGADDAGRADSGVSDAGGADAGAADSGIAVDAGTVLDGGSGWGRSTASGSCSSCESVWFPRFVLATSL